MPVQKRTQINTSVGNPVHVKFFLLRSTTNYSYSVHTKVYLSLYRHMFQLKLCRVTHHYDESPYLFFLCECYNQLHCEIKLLMTSSLDILISAVLDILVA